jgi:hypothetical protein
MHTLGGGEWLYIRVNICGIGPMDVTLSLVHFSLKVQSRIVILRDIKFGLILWSI